MTPRDHDSLAWGLGYASQRLEGALALAAPGGAMAPYVLRGVWRAACRELHYLELFVRRLLLCMAGEMVVETRTHTPGKAVDTCEGRYPGVDFATGSTPCQSGPWVPACAGTGGKMGQVADQPKVTALSAIHVRAKPDTGPNKDALSAIHRDAKRSGDQKTTALSTFHRDAKQSGDQTKKPEKAPLFPVFDRRPSEKAIQARLAAMAQWEDEAGAPQPVSLPESTRGTADPVVSAARLAARFAALADVLNNPQRHARRLARWRARRAACLLRLGAVPHLAKGGLMDLATASFFEAKRLALLTLNCGWTGPPDPPLNRPKPIPKPQTPSAPPAKMEG